MASLLPNPPSCAPLRFPPDLSAIQAVKLILEYKQGWELPFDHAAGIGLEEVDVTRADRMQTTPLMIAVQLQHVQVVQLLTATATLQHHPNVAMSLRCVKLNEKQTPQHKRQAG